MEWPAEQSRVSDSDPRRRLEHLSHLASEAGVLEASSEASLLATRAEEGLFYVACLGQFKRGKSTLINALLGEPILPTGVVPVTAIPTIVRHGLETSARVLFASSGVRQIEVGSLRKYVSEGENPGNQLEVRAVEVLHPHPLLASGLCLVDTPGLGSIYEVSTARTRAFLPHVDAALVVIGADPPISADELAMVREIASQVGRLEIILNKADRLSERERGEAKAFSRMVLEEALGRKLPAILETSGTQALAGQETYDFGALRSHLESYATESGADLISRAAEKGIARIAARVRLELDERREALLRPREESERRITRLDAAVRSAEASLADLSYLFAAEQDRLSASYRQMREHFLASVFPEAEAELEKELDADEGRKREGAATARRIAQRRIGEWLTEAEPRAEAAYRTAMQRFTRMVDDFFDRLSADSAGAEAFSDRRIEPETGFRARRRFFFLDLFELAPDESGIAAWVRSDARSRAAILEYLRALLDLNSVRAVNDFDERVTESRRRLEREISTVIRKRLDAARRALDRSRAVQGARAGAIEVERRRIEDLHARLARLVREVPDESKAVARHPS